ncbi:hypothetical protein GCM10009608_03880 [Pseudonocardia alaniniphila]
MTDGHYPVVLTSVSPMSGSRVRSFLAGVLVANSAPHLATAITRRRHLTPLAGRRSGPGVNGLWGLLNLLGGLLLLTPDAHRSPGTWDDDLVAFEGGVLALAAWMTVSERVLRTNTAR